MNNFIPNKILHLNKNVKGRDIVVGDIHGSFSLLKNALKSINFNPHIDRLLAVGDLVDRGSSSSMAIEWLKMPYFYSTYGNHDAQYMFNCSSFFNRLPIGCLPVDTWFLNVEYEEHFRTFQKKLYTAISVETDNGLVALVHAEIPLGLNWKSFSEKVNNLDYQCIHNAIWSRDIALAAIDKMDNDFIENEKIYFIDDLSHVFHGHSWSKNSKTKPFSNFSIGNRYYVDTGAYLHEKILKGKNLEDVAKYASLTLYDINDPINPIFNSLIDL